MSQIVMSDDENTAVHQAADFLAGDIAKISGYRPAIVKTTTSGNVSIRLVTFGYEQTPAVINAEALRGQWESYRIVTSGRDVWLVGSNPRGTAFAAYTLSERLGVDPIYIWSGYQPEHRDPLVLKRTDFSQAPPTFRYRGFFHDDEDLLPRPFDANGYPLQTGVRAARVVQTVLRNRAVVRRYSIQPPIRSQATVRNVIKGLYARRSLGY